MKLEKYWTCIHWVESGTLADLFEPYKIKTVQSSEFGPAQIEPRMHFTNIWRLQSFCYLETTVVKEHSRSFFSPSCRKHYKTRREIFFTVFSVIVRQQLYIVPCWQLEFWTHETYYIWGVGLVGSGQTFCRQSRFGLAFRRVGSKKSDPWTTLVSGRATFDVCH